MSEIEFTEKVNQCRSIIFKVIRLYVNNSEDEKDLYQEILLQAWRSYPKFRGESKFSTWLYRVALNTVLTFKQRPVVVKPYEDLSVFNHKEPASRPKDEVDALYNAIRSLNEIDRMIITLHLDGYSNEEVAGITGLSAGNVGVKLFRIRATLTNLLN